MNIFAWAIAILIAFLLVVLAIKTTMKIIKLIASALVVLAIVGFLTVIYLLSGSAPVTEITEINALEKNTALEMSYALMFGKENLSGYNTASFPPCITDYSEEGKIGGKFLGRTKTLIIIQTAHRKNLSVHLNIESHIEKKGIFSIIKNKKEKKLLEGEAIDVFLENIEEIALLYAGVANKTQAKYFTPFNELGCIVGNDKANEWYVKILPKIKEKYSGEIIEKINCMQ